MTYSLIRPNHILFSLISPTEQTNGMYTIHYSPKILCVGSLRCLFIPPYYIVYSFFGLFFIFFLLNQIFVSFFKTLVGKEVVVELKNGIMIRGSLVSVDMYV